MDLPHTDRKLCDQGNMPNEDMKDSQYATWQTSQTKTYREFRQGHVHVGPIQTFHVEYIYFAKITIAPTQHFLGYFRFFFCPVIDKS